MNRLHLWGPPRAVNPGDWAEAPRSSARGGRGSVLPVCLDRVAAICESFPFPWGGSMNTNFNLAEISEAIAAAIPDRECLVFRDRRYSWAQFNERTRRLGNYLASRSLGCR